jgi:hypothetical protein
MLGAGGIPQRTTVCATLAPLGGGKDDTAAIQAAIEACPAGQVVSLGAGTFTVAEGSYVALDKGVTLRGAGPGKTILTRTGGATVGSYQPGASPTPIISVGAARWGNGTSAGTALSVDAAAGSLSVQVASAAGFAVGQMVLLDEASGAGWQPERIAAWTSKGYTQIWASPDYRVVWQKHNPYYQYVDDFDAATFPANANSAGCWFSKCDRPVNELHQVTSISGNTITFDTPVTISYRTGHAAKLYYFDNSKVVRNAGIEDMTVSHGDDGNIHFVESANCWARNVENTLWLGHGFELTAALRVQLEHVYVHNAAWPVNGGGGYAIALNWGTSEALIEDSISVLANKVIVAQSAGTGSVVAYNYMDDGYINGQDGWVEAGINGSHMVGSHHMLFEGNQSFNSDSDETHGNSTYMVFYRNWLTGFRKPFTALDGTVVDDSKGCCGPQRAASAHAYASWFSFLGNVLGTSGAMSGWTYECVGSANNMPGNCIWQLGWMDITPQGDDPASRATAYRDGNYDYLTKSIRWDAGDTSKSLPASLYLSAKPAFFGNNPWPWVTPEGAQQLYTLPAKARYDAGTP